MLIDYLTWTLISLVLLTALAGSMLFVGGCYNVYCKKPDKLKTALMLIGGFIFMSYPIIIMVYWILTMSI